MKEITWEPPEILNFCDTYAINQTQFVGWVYVAEDLRLRVWAYRRTKKSGLEIREVIRANTKTVFIRCMYLTAMSGWRVFYKPTDAKSCGWYGYTYYECHKEDYNKWEEYYTLPGVHYPIINLDALKGTRYQFCGFKSGNIIEYIKLWEEHPCVEYFGKTGMAPSKAIIKKLEADHGFGKWLAKQNKEELKESGAQAILYAYTHHKPLCEAKDICTEKNQATQLFKRYDAVKRSGLDKIKVYRYIMANNTATSGRYNDYIDACINLGLDLKDTKNAYPKDFKRMHDLRTNQWGAKREKINKNKFKEAAKKYKAFEFSNKDFLICIPSTPQDLKKEGRKLHHCVGAMGYDRKMIRGQSFIAFLRKAGEPDTPFITIEYDNKEKRIRQIYGDYDSTPPEDAREFAKLWERRVKETWTTAQK